jgi:hypothetical protein
MDISPHGLSPLALAARSLRRRRILLGARAASAMEGFVGAGTV